MNTENTPRTARRLGPEWLAVVPILVGWINDSFIFHYLASKAQLSPTLFSYFALFDLFEKILLSNLGGYFLLCALNPSHQHKLPLFLRSTRTNMNSQRSSAVTVIFLMLFLETLVRLGAIFGWVGMVVYRLASAWNVSATIWACWPLIFWSASIILGKNLNKK